MTEDTAPPAAASPTGPSRRNVLGAAAVAVGLAVTTGSAAFAEGAGTGVRYPGRNLAGRIGYAPAIPVSAEDTDAVLEAKAAHVVPTDGQLAWQRMGQTAFLHFNMPTFLNVEGGDGRAPAATFAPTAVDARQWATTLKQGGYGLAILTVKHADGFLLYPSAHSDYSVANSPYRNGQADIVREFVDAMHDEGLRVGLYFSPLNRHEGNIVESSWVPGLPRFGYSGAKGNRTVTIPEHPVEGRPSFTFETDEYNELYLRQLYEIFSNYGEIDEWWIDGNATSYTMGGSSWDGWKGWPGATGSATQRYDNSLWYQLADALQPGMLKFNGWDIRWVGNETGFARVGGEWSTIAVSNDPGDAVPEKTPGGLPGDSTTWAGAKNLVWMPTEVDVPISAQGNWFHHIGDTPRSLEELRHIHAASVGRNANLLLDFAPDRNGVIPPAQADRARELREAVDAVFGHDLGGRTKLVASSNGTVVERRLRRETTIDWIGLREDVARTGQRVEAFTVQAWDKDTGTWNSLTTTTWDKKGQVIADTTERIGFQRYLHLSTPVRTKRVRIVVTSSRLTPHITSLTLHRE